MSQAAVYDILDRIRQLPAEERRLLEELLSQQEEAEWREEAARARKMARDNGIDQDEIYRAAHAVRHGA